MVEQNTRRTDKTNLDGFHTVLGYNQHLWEENKAIIELKLQPMHLNLGGVIHGGVLASVLDIAMAMAGTYCPYPGRIRRAITLSLTTTFTGQCSAGTIYITGYKRAGGSRIFNSTGEVHDDKGNLLAIAEGTFRVRTGSENPEGVPI